MTIFRSYASCLAFWVGASVAACVGAAEPAPPLPLQKGIVYRQVAGQTLRLDLARPAQADGPLPAIICIHGGGWSLGYRGALHPFVQYFAQRGYVTVTIDYRLSPRHRFPAHIEDVKAAIRFLRKQAGQYGIDPQRIGTLGFSAGGHLALLAATTGPDDGLDGEHEDAVSSQVQAAVNYFGSVNFQTWRMTEEGQQRVRRNYKGKSFEEVMAGIFGHYDPQAPIMRQASPATYLDPADPPMLTFHGTEDPSVAFSQAVEFDEAARRAGARHRLVTLEGEGHGWTGALLDQTLEATLDFFDEHLKQRRLPVPSGE